VYEYCKSLPDDKFKRRDKGVVYIYIVYEHYIVYTVVLRVVVVYGKGKRPGGSTLSVDWTRFFRVAKAIRPRRSFRRSRLPPPRPVDGVFAVRFRIQMNRADRARRRRIVVVHAVLSTDDRNPTISRATAVGVLRNYRNVCCYRGKFERTRPKPKRVDRKYNSFFRKVLLSSILSLSTDCPPTTLLPEARLECGEKRKF